jgi:hypothetical protein
MVLRRVLRMLGEGDARRLEVACAGLVATPAAVLMLRNFAFVAVWRRGQRVRERRPMVGFCEWVSGLYGECSVLEMRWVLEVRWLAMVWFREDVEGNLFVGIGSEYSK